MTPEEKFSLIVRNLEEHYGDEYILKILQERDLKLYWGAAPTGPPHCGSLWPSERLEANCRILCGNGKDCGFLESRGSRQDFVVSP